MGLPLPIGDPTLWTVVRMVRDSPADPRPLARLFYYLGVAHPDDLERKAVEALVAVPIMSATWWAAWEELKKLRQRFMPPGGDELCTG